MLPLNAKSDRFLAAKELKLVGGRPISPNYMLERLAYTA